MQQPPIPEPAGLVKAGVTTSEWALVVRYLQGLVAAGIVTAVAYATARLGFRYSIPPEVLATLVGFAVSGGIAVVGYAISRGLAKMGIPGAVVAGTAPAVQLPGAVGPPTP